MSDIDIHQALLEARAMHEEDINRLGEMEEPQLRYLGGLRQITDPATDGLECDTEERE